MLDKDDRKRFFEESFLLANIKLEIVFKMSFLTMSNADVNFQAQNLQWRSYITRDVLPTTRQFELIEKKEFTAATLDPEHKAFVVHIVALNVDLGDEMHPSIKAQVAYLKVNEAPTKVASKYADFADVFSPKLATELPKHMGINDYAIELVDN